MELSFLPLGHQQRLSSLSSFNQRHFFSKSRRSDRKPSSAWCCFCSRDAYFSESGGRRALVGLIFAAATGLNMCRVAEAVSSSRRALRGAKVPESDFTTLPNGLKYYDLKVGGGFKAVKGSRVARLLIVPPELAYGSKGVQEIPPNATIELDVELLSIKSSPFGSSVKLIEG